MYQKFENMWSFQMTPSNYRYVIFMWAKCLIEKPCDKQTSQDSHISQQIDQFALGAIQKHRWERGRRGGEGGGLAIVPLQSNFFSPPNRNTYFLPPRGVYRSAALRTETHLKPIRSYQSYLSAEKRKLVSPPQSYFPSEAHSDNLLMTEKFITHAAIVIFTASQERGEMRR